MTPREVRDGLAAYTSAERLLDARLILADPTLPESCALKMYARIVVDEAGYSDLWGHDLAREEAGIRKAEGER